MGQIYSQVPDLRQQQSCLPGKPVAYALLQVDGASQHVMDDDLKAEVLRARVIVDPLPPLLGCA